MHRLARTTLAKPAVWAALLYVGLAAATQDTIPFVQLEMFRFYVPDGATVVPVSYLDGKRAPIDSVVGFSGVTGQNIDVTHQGYQCSVEHRFREQRDWIDAHPAGERGAGPIEVVVGVEVLHLIDGTLTERFREDGRGSAWPK
jgi:hypothetical protein